MPLKITHCDDTDMPLVFAIISNALGSIPYMDAVYLGHNNSSGREIGARRMLELKHADPSTYFVNAVDAVSGKIIGVAEWILYGGNVPDETELEGNYWNSEEDEAYANYLRKSYLAPRRKAVKEMGGRVVSLDILAVSPEWQGHGAGRLLVERGTTTADTLGHTTVVESTDKPVKFYEKAGFEHQFGYTKELPARFEQRREQPLHWMIRPAKKVD